MYRHVSRALLWAPLEVLTVRTGWWGGARASRPGAPEGRQTSCWRVSNTAEGVVGRRHIHYIRPRLGT
jgi:hypothetical protein